MMLPKGWELKKVGELCEVKGGKRLPKNALFSDRPTNRPYLRVTDMTNKSINNRELKYISEDMFEKIKKYTISKEDVYITIAGTLGSSGIVPAELDGASLTENAAKLVIKDKQKLNKSYLVYAIDSSVTRLQIKNLMGVVGVPKLALFRIESITIPLPPLSVQHRIVSILENAEAIKEKRKQIIEYTNQLAQSVFLEMFGDPEANLAGWIVKPIEDTCGMTSGGTPNRSKLQYYRNGEIPWVKSGEVNNRYIFDTEEKITEEGLKNSSAKYFEPNTILVAMYGATAGKIAVLKIKATTNQAIAGLTCDQNIVHYEYIHHCLEKMSAK